MRTGQKVLALLQEHGPLFTRELGTYLNCDPVKGLNGVLRRLKVRGLITSIKCKNQERLHSLSGDTRTRTLPHRRVQGVYQGHRMESLLRLLQTGPLTIQDVAYQSKVSQQTVTLSLRRLVKAGQVVETRVGQRLVFSLPRPPG